MRRALGKGIEALLPGSPPTPAPTPSAVPTGALQVPVAEITANPAQPRRHFDEDALDTLASSIRLHGLLQPIVVRRTSSGFELIAGERRLRASMRAGLERVPVVVREASSQERLELALIENIQRQDLSPLEEAEAYRHLLDQYGLTQDEIARRVGKSRPAITNTLRLLNLPEPVKAQLEAGELTVGHARAVLGVDGAPEQIRFAREIVDQQMPRPQAERIAAERRTTPKRGGRPKSTATADPNWHAVAEELTRSLGTRVRMTRKGRGGTIEIEFYSEPELNRLIDRLRGAPRTSKIFDSPESPV